MSCLRSFWLGIVAGMPLCVFAQSERFEGQPIRSIEYSPTQQPLSQSDLSRLQPLQLGQPLRRDEVKAAIDKLFSSGEYEDVQVEVEPRGDGVTVKFVTKPRTFIGHIGVRGKISEPPKAGQLQDATQLRLGQPLESKELTDADAAMQDLLRRNGLYGATVSHHLAPAPDGQMTITFEVKSGKRARFDTPVITGDPKLPDKDIIKSTGWRRFLIGGWRPVTAVRVRNGVAGIQKKYQKKDRLMAKVQLKSLDYNAAANRAKPTLDIQAGPKVKVKAVEAKVSKRTLRKYVPIYEEQSVDRDLIVEGARNLRDYFQSQGYYQADIDFRETPHTNTDELTIEYVIAKGARHKLVHIDVNGNKYFADDTIRDLLILRTASFPAFRHGRYSEAYRQRDEQDITNLYKSNGFRDVKVTSTVQDNYKGKTGDIAVAYNIEEGSQWRIAKLDINGISSEASTIIMPQLNSNSGQPFSEVNVAADRKTILDYYFTHGYPSAQFRWKYTDTDEPNQVNVDYDVTEGPQRFVRDVLISGLETTRRRLVDHALGVHKGDPLSPIAITNTQHQFYNLGVFSKVQAALQDPEGATTEKYVLFDFQEAARYTLRLGVGADISRFGPTTTNLSTPNNSTGFSPRFSVDVSRLNLFGIGHQVSVQGRVSSFEQRLLFNYYAPRFQNVEGRNITFSTLYDYSRDVRTFTSKREEASIQVSQRFTKAVNGLFRYAYRRVSTSNIVIPTLLVPQLVQPVRIGILSASIIQDRRDNPAQTTHGIYNTIDFGVAYKAFGSQRNFLRGLGRNATYTRIGKNLVLARELTFGLIVPFSNARNLSSDNVVPLPERFFGGGGQSHRAFAENQAGPRDIGMPAGPGAPATAPTGFPLGGNALLVHQTELRFPLLGENIGGVFFHDMGNIFDKFSNISFRMSQRNLQDFNYMVHAVGFGVRYKTPVGPVRLDLAYSINPPSYVGFKGSFQDLLQCNPNSAHNPSFCTGVPQSAGHFQFFFSIGQTF